MTPILPPRPCGEILSDPDGYPIDPWLIDLFRDEYCAECQGDAEHHTVIPFMGNPFARCDYPPDEDGKPHPVIAAFRGAIR